MIKRIGVFCGSNFGSDPQYLETAIELGRYLAGQKIGLVYGGASVGLMGAMADAALSQGGEVIGVIPQALVNKEVAHQGLNDLRIVNTMHERKALMESLSDGFIALPGGFGTLDEFCEILTWAQLGLHEKPCGLLNVNGYFEHFLAFINHATAQGFVRPEHQMMVLRAQEPKELLEMMKNQQLPKIRKWITAKTV